MSKIKKTNKLPVDIAKKTTKSLKPKVPRIEEPLTEAVDPLQDVKQLVQRYIIAEQTLVVNTAITHIDGFYDKEAFRNLPDDGLESNKNNWLLVWNDLASQLSQKGEVVLYSKQGTWWHTQIDEHNNILTNPALLAIAKDIRDRMNQPKESMPNAE